MKGVSLLTNKTEGLFVSDSLIELRGAEMDAYQAATFVKSLGIIVSE